MDRHSLKPRSTRSSHSFKFIIFSIFVIFSLCAAGVNAAPTSESTRSSSNDSTTSTSTPSATETEPPTTIGTSGGGVSSDYSVPTPRAFDSSLVLNNFTSDGCQPFFDNFLNNATFVNCLPLSFFLQNSNSWFDITKAGLIPTTKALDESCSVNSQQCTAVMNDLALQMLQVSNCGTDFKARNPIILQAYASFLTYPILFAAGCQRSSTGYCYADAITNTTSPADSYVYLLPLGVAIPGGSTLTCSSCLQRTMSIFAAAAGNQSLPLSTTYVPAAQLIDLGCGPGFANTTISSISTNAAISTRSRTWIPTMAIVAIVSIIVSL